MLLLHPLASPPASRLRGARSTGAERIAAGENLRSLSNHWVRKMSAASTGEQVNAIVKLLSEKSISDARHGAKLLLDFVKDNGSSGRGELLQWGVVHSVMTLLTEVSTAYSVSSYLSSFLCVAGLQRAAQNRGISVP